MLLLSSLIIISSLARFCLSSLGYFLWTYSNISSSKAPFILSAKYIYMNRTLAKTTLNINKCYVVIDDLYNQIVYPLKGKIRDICGDE